MSLYGTHLFKPTGSKKNDDENMKKIHKIMASDRRFMLFLLLIKVTWVFLYIVYLLKK